MQPQILVVSDPPHREVDLEAVAAILGLELADARLKIDFPAPEVLAASDPDRAVAMAASLRGAGLRVKVIDGQELAGVPWPAPADSFELRSEGLLARFAAHDIEVPYDTPVVGVYCKPPADFPEGGPDGETAALTPDDDGFTIAEAIEWMANLDLYFTRGGVLRRVSIVQDATDFSGLGDMRRATLAENMAAIVAECDRRFAHIELDSRLENVRPRHRFSGGDYGFDMDLRKAFSFGTLLLRQVLDSISPELRDVPQYELGSRLAYVLSRHAGDEPADG